MKIAYIGAGDALAETLIERMGQEGNDVYLLSDENFPQKPKGVSLQRFYRFYRSPKRGKSFEKLLCSIAPDVVIFAGNHYIGSAGGEESDADVTLLARSLRAAATFPHVKFILLSSTEVYGNTEGEAGESAERTATDERGLRFNREEQLLTIYWKQYGMDVVILRASQLYSSRCREGRGDMLSRSFSAALQAENSMPAYMFQPLHVSDFADAVKRVMDAGKYRVYNVCGSAGISAERLYRLICRQEKCEEKTIRWEKQDCITLADSGRIRKELGWSDFRNLEEQLPFLSLSRI